MFRLFRLLDEFRLRHTPVTAQELSEDLGVSLRTLYRDIADLQAMGAPIRGEGGVGYVMEPGYFLPSLRFDADELEAIALGVRLVVSRGDPKLAEAAVRASAKIASTVNEGARRAFLVSPVESGPSALGRTPHLETLRDSVRQRKVLEIAYEALTGKASVRRARPLGLTVFDTVWLLTIWCERASDFRHLRVDRIRSIKETGACFRDEAGKRFSDCLTREGNATFPRGVIPNRPTKPRLDSPGPA
ncbi:helix-turn-helix transcriptional regulator [Roseateles asaccharophilus]|uniref:helix-turn-helix transcriptional regulator n=1 Tax=Roseateles asaccharophilus TaxID=582607 RepID=UPI001B85B585